MSIPSPTATLDIDKIDLDRHGLIEASAGTGKTYTIENLVIRLLKEVPNLSLENILLVTYTEKAASELKVRLLEKIESTLKTKSCPPPENPTTQALERALDGFDTASIQTIHGFCHTLLKDFSFENDTLFQTELIDDRPLYEKALKAQMRSVWPELYGHQLPPLLSISGFSDNPTTFENTIIGIAAGGYRPEGGDRLYPDPADIDTHSLIQAFENAKIALKLGFGPGTRFIDGYRQLNFHAGSKKAIITRILTPLERWLNDGAAVSPDLGGFADLCTTMNDHQRFKTDGPQILKPLKYNGDKDNAQKVCPSLDDLIDSLSHILHVFHDLKHILQAETILRLKKEVDRRKRVSGTIAYDDMLTRVLAALKAPQAERLLERLRERYRFAFVDEFQDTDPIQWRIFERIFLENGACRLFLIGDPKQAIYSFRGADVFTYLSARSKLHQLAEDDLAGCYTLDTNYRSAPSLVSQYNRLFANEAWFGPSREMKWHEISYTPVASPDPQRLPAGLAQDNSGRTALNIVDLRGPDKPAVANDALARFIASEIAYLLRKSRVILQSKDGTTRPLDAGDIAILVRSRTNVHILENALAAKGIPYSYYRKPGLFDSDEAWYLSLVLRAIETPSNGINIKKALLTPFFEWQTGDLGVFDNLPISHPIRRLILHWHDLANERRWGALFQSILTDSGLIFRHSQNAGWDRMEANYNQIIAYINDVAYRNNLDLSRLSAHLEGLRRKTLIAGEKGDIHEIETEKRKVQILTMHRAKGLQFPIVFIGGGLTRGLVNNYHHFHQIDNDHSHHTTKIIDLTCRVHPQKHQQEIVEEDKRLYYVALTRAQCKLYLPYFPAVTNKPYFGPLCLFVAQAIQATFASDPQNQTHATWLNAYESSDVREADSTSSNEKILRDVSPSVPSENVLPNEESYLHRTVAVESFSSIHAKQMAATTPASIHTTFHTAYNLGPAVLREDDEDTRAPVLRSISSKRPANDIPGGPDVGSMFHTILENIDFETITKTPDALFGNSPTAALVDRQMASYNIDLAYRNEVAQVIIHTLTSPIPQINKQFCLGSLIITDRLHEVDFYYSTEPSSNRYIRGVIDLVFRHENKYYIADWKSNRLDTGYDLASMSASMDTADYHLQYRLYTVAVLRWLKRTLGKRFNADDQFGGAFYFYLRGMGAKTGEGIYYIPPAEVGSLKDLEASISDFDVGPIIKVPR